MNYHGSVLLQHLLHFEDPSTILQSLGSMVEDDLSTVACSQAGSHVFDALLTSNVTEKQRKKILRKLRVKMKEMKIFQAFVQSISINFPNPNAAIFKSCCIWSGVGYTCLWGPIKSWLVFCRVD